MVHVAWREREREREREGLDRVGFINKCLEEGKYLSCRNRTFELTFRIGLKILERRKRRRRKYLMWPGRRAQEK